MKALGKKEHEIRQSCMACGYSTTLDQKHRLAVFIVKNPPPDDEKTEKAMKVPPYSRRQGVMTPIHVQARPGAKQVSDGEYPTF